MKNYEMLRVNDNKTSNDIKYDILMALLANPHVVGTNNSDPYNCKHPYTNGKQLLSIVHKVASDLIHGFTPEKVTGLDHEQDPEITKTAGYQDPGKAQR